MRHQAAASSKPCVSNLAVPTPWCTTSAAGVGPWTPGAGTSMENVWSILNNGLLNASGTRLERTGGMRVGRRRGQARHALGDLQPAGFRAAGQQPRRAAPLAKSPCATLGHNPPATSMDCIPLLRFYTWPVSQTHAFAAAFAACRRCLWKGDLF